LFVDFFFFFFLPINKCFRFRRLAIIQRNSWIVSPLAQLLYFAVLTTLGVVSGFGVYYSAQDPLNWPSCWDEDVLNLIIVQAVVVILLIALACFFLWDVADAYLIKHELSTVLFVGIPTLVVWVLSSFFSWTGFLSVDFWQTIIELLAMAVTIWMPMVGSFVYERAVKRRARMRSEREMEEGSMTSSHHLGDDDFRYVLKDEELLLPIFERSESLYTLLPLSLS